MVAHAKFDFINDKKQESSDDITDDVIRDWCFDYIRHWIERSTMRTGDCREIMSHLGCTDWGWINHDYDVKCTSINEVAYYLLVDAFESNNLKWAFIGAVTQIFAENLKEFAD